ncbi:hypothetical protein LINGRAHAP2_LOCUS25125, partial [Linum grandiflorum]
MMELYYCDGGGDDQITEIQIEEVYILSGDDQITEIQIE